MEALQIKPYDPSWVAKFEAERDRIALAFGKLAIRIDHNGSTSVPRLAAKPVIDIQISVEHLQPMNTYAEPLTSLGYIHVPHVDDAFCPYFHRPEKWPHTYHVHVVKAGGEEERRTLAFRDLLRQHKEAAKEYEILKKTLASKTDANDANSREAYAIAKGEFIERIIKMAFAAGYPRELRH